MSGKIFNKAVHNKRLSDSGLFNNNLELEKSLLIAVVHHVHVLYKREAKTYYFIYLLPETGYQLLLKSYQTTKLELSDIKFLVEKQLKENVDGGGNQD